VAGFATVITAVAGLSLAIAGPAAANGSQSWRPYGNTNPITSSASTWRCGNSENPAGTGNVFWQICAVRAPDGHEVQAALVVRNDNSGPYTVETQMDLASGTTGKDLWEGGCNPSGVAAHSWSVCFGPTLTTSGPVFASGSENGENFVQTPVV
jgi:hypothetical protein